MILTPKHAAKKRDKQRDREGLLSRLLSRLSQHCPAWDRIGQFIVIAYIKSGQCWDSQRDKSCFLSGGTPPLGCPHRDRSGQQRRSINFLAGRETWAA